MLQYVQNGGERALVRRRLARRQCAGQIDDAVIDDQPGARLPAGPEEGRKAI
jgi:hypothetical protein